MKVEEEPSTAADGERRTYRRTGPERTGVPNRGGVAEGQSSEGQSHHGAAEQQLQQAEGEQRPPGQQLPRAAGRHARRRGPAAGSTPVGRLAVLRDPAHRTAGARQHHRQRHFRRLEANPSGCGLSARKGPFPRSAGCLPPPSWWAVLNNTQTERHRCRAHFHIVWQAVQAVGAGGGAEAAPHPGTCEQLLWKCG